MLKFDVPAIFYLAGGPAALRKALVQDQGCAPSKAVVGMWKTRGRISPHWLPSCVYAVLSRTPELKPLALLVPETDTDPGDLFER